MSGYFYIFIHFFVKMGDIKLYPPDPMGWLDVFWHQHKPSLCILHTDWHPQRGWPYMPPLPPLDWGGQWPGIATPPLLLGCFPHTLHKQQLTYKETHPFFKFVNSSQGHSVWPKSSFFCRKPRCLWVLPLPTLFLLLSLLWPLSLLSLWHPPPSFHICILDIFLIFYVLNYSDHFAVCPFALLDNYNFELKWSKNFPSWDFVGHHIVYLMLRLHDILMWY